MYICTVRIPCHCEFDKMYKRDGSRSSPAGGRRSVLLSGDPPLEEEKASIESASGRGGEGTQETVAVIVP